MRLCTVHPRYLDPQGLVALWRESLPAQQVLRGGTRGDTQHPQRVRFRSMQDPPGAIATYLRVIAGEGAGRGYRFDPARIGREATHGRLGETEGAPRFEQHLRLYKLSHRSPGWVQQMPQDRRPEGIRFLSSRPAMSSLGYGSSHCWKWTSFPAPASGRAAGH